MRDFPSGVVGVVAGLLLLAGGVVAVPLSRVDRAPRVSPETSVELLQPYDASFVEIWIRGCMASGESRAFCRCAIDEYTTRLRPDEFETASAVAHSGGDLAELPDNVRDAILDVERDCR